MSSATFYMCGAAFLPASGKLAMTAQSGSKINFANFAMRLVRPEYVTTQDLRLSECHYRCAVVLLLLSLTTGACQSNSGGQLPDTVATVFADFELLEKRELSAATEDALAIPIVRTVGQHPERTFDEGYVYLFLTPDELDDEDLALSILPSRLSAIGATLAKVPRSSADLMTTTVGGPLFRIEFGWKEKRGVIYNRLGRVDDKPADLLLFELR
jgi:hypothetical protein